MTVRRIFPQSGNVPVAPVKGQSCMFSGARKFLSACGRFREMSGVPLREPSEPILFLAPPELCNKGKRSIEY